MPKIVFIVFSLFTFVLTARAETIVFEGVPVVRTVSSLNKTTNEPVKGKDQIEFHLLITKEGEDYFWASRGKKKLMYTQSGIFDYFVCPDGTGYIKIAKTEDNRFIYFEQMNKGLLTITYWGGSDSFAP